MKNHFPIFVFEPGINTIFTEHEGVEDDQVLL